MENVLIEGHQRKWNGGGEVWRHGGDSHSSVDPSPSELFARPLASRLKGNYLLCSVERGEQKSESNNFPLPDNTLLYKWVFPFSVLFVFDLSVRLDHSRFRPSSGVAVSVFCFINWRTASILIFLAKMELASAKSKRVYKVVLTGGKEESERKLSSARA